MSYRSFVCLVALVVVVLGCGSSEAAPPVRGGEWLFADPGFRRGFVLSFPSSKMGWKPAGVLRPRPDGPEPRWRLAQWGTRHSLAGAKPKKRGGTVVFENAAKRVVIGVGGGAQSDLTLEIRGSREYGRGDRKRGEAWPHLLVDQQATGLIRLNELQSLDLTIDVRLGGVKANRESGYDRNLHSAQFQLFLVVRNVERESADFGNFLWFGVPLYDQRHEYPPGHQAKDAGKDDASGKFIYSVSGREILPEPLKPGRWVRVETNLLPKIRTALETAVARGFLDASNPQQYAIAAMNLGWELTGNFDATADVRGFDVRAVRRKGERGK